DGPGHGQGPAHRDRVPQRLHRREGQAGRRAHPGERRAHRYRQAGGEGRARAGQAPHPRAALELTANLRGCHSYILIYRPGMNRRLDLLPNLASARPKPVPSGGSPLRAETAAKLLYRELKADIVSMRRKPGEAIVEREIASRYGVSRTPVREAILRLADE